MEKEAIQHLQDHATLNEINAVLGDEPGALIALPETAHLEDLEKYMDTRRRFRGEFSTNDPKAFASYCVDNAASDILGGCFIDADAMTALAIMDLGTVNAPLHAEHRAALSLQKTAAFKALRQIEGERRSQKDTAEWLEDWMPHLNALISGPSGPEPCVITKAIAAIRRVTLRTNSEQEHEDQDFGGRRSAMESVEASSREQPLPSFFEFTCNPYHGLDERTFRLRVSLITGTGEPQFRLRMVQAEQQHEEMADEFAGLVRQEIGGVMPVTIGRMKA